MIESTPIAHEGDVLAGTLYRPDPTGGPMPAVLGGPGLGAVKEMGLPHLARALADAGIATLLIDYAGFGGSTGERRQHVDPWAQVDQLRSALDHLGSIPGIDPDRLGVVGPSLAGGHALHLAATDDRIRAAVAIAPFVRTSPTSADARIVGAVVADAEARLAGAPHGMIPIVGRPGELAILTSDGAWEWVQAQLDDLPDVPAEVTLASLVDVAGYAPLDDVTGFDVPVRVILAEADTVTPASDARDALASCDSVDLVSLPATHFSIFDTHLGATTDATVEWFARHL